MSAARELTIRLASKVASPHSHADFRLTHRPIHYAGFIKNLGKIVVRRFIYPSFTCPPSTLNFSDQYAFRPTGCTTAALIFTAMHPRY